LAIPFTLYPEPVHTLHDMKKKKKKKGGRRSVECVNTQRERKL
jgi:hypothetical protein